MPNFNKLLKSSIIKEIAPKEIEKEINFQIDVFENSSFFAKFHRWSSTRASTSYCKRLFDKSY